MGTPRSPKGRATQTALRLAAEYPGSPRDLCALDHDDPFQLLVATILSAQSTDAGVNRVTPALFARYPTAFELAEADQLELEAIIKPTGFFHAKGRSLVGMASALVERFDGVVPSRMADLVTLPGVGRKTANVILSVDFGVPGLPVDTHVLRLSGLLGLTDESDPVKVEAALCRLLVAREWGPFSLRVILHGRRVCVARRPRCDLCVLSDFCPSSQMPGRRSAPST